MHKTAIAKDATEFALQMLRDQIGQKVYPAHRLDRKTSGVLLFTKTQQSNEILQRMFRERRLLKTYLAIVRGFAPEEGHIDYPVKEKERPKEAITDFIRLEQFEIPLPFGEFPTSRYSLVELKPLTGRFHQLRKHMAHIHHPIIGDRPHGCNKQNKLWKERFHMTSMLLHAQKMVFEFPEGELITVAADTSSEFKRVLDLLQKGDTSKGVT